jgi:hypothetical protein
MITYPRRLIKSGKHEILLGGKFFIRNGKLHEFVVLVKNGIKNAVEELEKKESMVETILWKDIF